MDLTPDKKVSVAARKAVVFLAAVFLLICIDQLTKAWAVSSLKDGDPIVLIEGVLEFFYVENKGAAFGILYGRHYLFVALALIISIFVFIYYMLMPVSARLLPLNFILIFIAAGALGNCLDRLMYGYVVDFIYFKLIDFPVFNFADILVTSAAFLLIFLFAFIYKDDDLNKLPFLSGKPGTKGGSCNEDETGAEAGNTQVSFAADCPGYGNEVRTGPRPGDGAGA